MKTKYVIGTIILLCIIGTADVTNADSNKRPDGLNEVGRYQLVVNPHQTTGAYLLDTKTGRIWRETQASDSDMGGAVAWIYQDRIDNVAEFSQWIKAVEEANKKHEEKK